MRLKMFKNNESGFSLVELAVAAALAVALSSIAVMTLSGTVERAEGKATAYADCGLKHQSAAKDLINGIEPTADPTCTPAPTPAP